VNPQQDCNFERYCFWYESAMVAVKQSAQLHVDCNGGTANIKTDSEGSDSGNDQHDG